MRREGIAVVEDPAEIDRMIGQAAQCNAPLNELLRPAKAGRIGLFLLCDRTIR